MDIRIFKLGQEESAGNNGVGCACPKPSVRRKAWRGGSWQSGLGRAVSCLMWLEPSKWGCRHRRGQQGKIPDCFTDAVSRKQQEP